MRLRTRLILLVIATALPLATLALVASLLLIANEQEKFVNAVKDRNRAFMTAVDAELKGELETLAAICALPAFESDDLAELHRELAAVKATQPDWITILVNTADGTPKVNTLVPYGAPLPEPLDPESVKTAARTQVPVIGGIVQEKLIDTVGIPLRYPIVRHGQTVYVLTAVLQPAVFQRMIMEQNLAPGWVTGLVDANHRFIARVPARPAGSMAGSDFRRAIAESSEGWYRGLTIDGLDTFTAFKRSDYSLWIVGFAMPASAVLEGSRRIAWTMGLIALACSAFALGIAFWLGHRISAPISKLARAAPTIGESPTAIDADSRVPEVRELANALRTASAAIQDKHRVAALERSILAESDRAKDEFIAMLSHEMRNPLAAITTASTLLKIAPPGSDIMAKAQGVIERQTKQLARLVEDLLDASRLAMGKATLERQDVDLAELAVMILNTWRDAGKLTEHELTVETAPVWVHADRVRLEQVISNLLDNAIKFTPSRGRISVTVRREGNAAKLIVRDSGAGIPAQELANVFGLFVQGPQGLSRAQGGIGVGLAIVKRLIEMHGGQVSVESEGLDRGSAFTVILPAIQPGRRVVQRGDSDSNASQRGLDILVVEDNTDTRDMICAVLRLRGHTVYAASDGASALSLAKQHLVHLALIDIGLPDRDGYEVARALRQTCRYLVALTGYGQPDDKERAIAAGFEAHVTKPISAEELDRLIETVASTLDLDERMRASSG